MAVTLGFDALQGALKMSEAIDLLERAFAHAGRRIEWRGKGIDEIGVDARNGDALVKIDPRYFRPTEVDYLCGDASKAHQRLGWRPEIGFDDLVRQMVEEDLRVADRIKIQQHE